MQLFVLTIVACIAGSCLADSYGKPVYPAHAVSHSYPAHAPHVKCGQHLLVGCAPNVAHVPCKPVHGHHGYHAAPEHHHAAPAYHHAAPEHHHYAPPAKHHAAPAYHAPAPAYEAPKKEYGHAAPAYHHAPAHYEAPKKEAYGYKRSSDFQDMAEADE